MTETIYKRLAEKLDALPNGFPATEDGSELLLLAKLFTPEEAALTCELFSSKQTPEEIHNRLVLSGRHTMDLSELKKELKLLARKGLIAVGRTENGLGYGLLPFVSASMNTRSVELTLNLHNYSRIIISVHSHKP